MKIVMLRNTKVDRRSVSVGDLVETSERVGQRLIVMGKAREQLSVDNDQLSVPPTIAIGEQPAMAHEPSQVMEIDEQPAVGRKRKKAAHGD